MAPWTKLNHSALTSMPDVLSILDPGNAAGPTREEISTARNALASEPQADPVDHTKDSRPIDFDFHAVPNAQMLVLGTDQRDNIVGSVGASTLSGGAGNDHILGGAHNDLIYGGADNDVLRGLGGQDLMLGGTGNDSMQGDAGHDTLHGGNGNDLMYGDTANGNGDGDDSMTGGRGNDTMDGGAGKDYLDGGMDNDKIYGGSGDDTIVGGYGADTMTGGAGRDTYIFNSVAETHLHYAETDLITDFNHGLDTIDLSRIDANTGVAGNQAFHYVVHDNDPLGAGEMSWYYDAANDKTVIELGTNATAGADTRILLDGEVILNVTDFVM